MRSGIIPGSCWPANHRASYSRRSSAARSSHRRRRCRMSDEDTRQRFVWMNYNAHRGAQAASRAQVSRSIGRAKPQTLPGPWEIVAFCLSIRCRGLMMLLNVGALIPAIQLIVYIFPIDKIDRSDTPPRLAVLGLVRSPPRRWNRQFVLAWQCRAWREDRVRSRVRAVQ